MTQESGRRQRAGTYPSTRMRLFVYPSRAWTRTHIRSDTSTHTLKLYFVTHMSRHTHTQTDAHIHTQVHSSKLGSNLKSVQIKACMHARVTGLTPYCVIAICTPCLLIFGCDRFLPSYSFFHYFPRETPPSPTTSLHSTSPPSFPLILQSLNIFFNPSRLNDSPSNGFSL